MGEEIWRRLSCKTIHDDVGRGLLPNDATQQHVNTFDKAWDVGVLCVGLQGWAAVSNRSMAWAALDASGVVGKGG
jgi:hypothetical protein